MTSATYQTRRAQLETYFDRTAAEAWKRLTSDAPVGGVRATVRAGRKEMREALLARLPADLRGARVLDAGCGTGTLAMDLVARGADVLAIDISATLIRNAQDRLPQDAGPGRVRFAVGDMLDPRHGRFDYVVAMDSLIHYEGADIARTLGALAQRTEQSLVFTAAPRTWALMAMWTLGQWFPRGDRSPAIAPIAPAALARALALHAPGLTLTPAHRVSRGFYISQAYEARRS